MVCKSNTKNEFKVELKVNGKNVELNSFVQGFIAETIIGMSRSLRDVEEVERLSLSILKKQ